MITSLDFTDSVLRLLRIILFEIITLARSHCRLRAIFLILFFTLICCHVSATRPPLLRYYDDTFVSHYLMSFSITLALPRLFTRQAT